MNIRLMRRALADIFSGQRIAALRSQYDAALMRPVHEIRQLIMAHELSENKIRNIRIAVSRIGGVIVAPGEIFSFWRLVGKPDRNGGFREGRVLSNGRLGTDIGGGLCQLAGIIYHLALVCGMDIIERHPHSIDLYTDEERYTPLGTDAAVLYGYKDLRFINTSDGPVSLKFFVNGRELGAEMLATRAINACGIDIIISQSPGRIEAITRRMKPGSPESEIIAVSRYKIHEHHHG